jgi:hemerythrin
MAVGPSLRQLHAHHAIHEGGIAGAIEKTELYEQLIQKNEQELAGEALEELLDYWETRIISHADAEEDGFYQEVVERKPDLQNTITKLMRDHDLLRIIVKNIRQLREVEGLVPEIMKMLDSLIIVNEIHSRDEEKFLF